MIKRAILDGKLLVCWKTYKWMREYLCTYVITILLQQMTSYRENSCRFLPWSCSFLFCLKDFFAQAADDGIPPEVKVLLLLFIVLFHGCPFEIRFTLLP
jgi:hypothetical protein